MGIKVKNLNYTYNKGMPDETQAISDLSFEIPDKSIQGIIGATGSGKSTLLMLLSGLIKPDSGSIKQNGRVGIVFQYPEYQLFEETVERDVAFGPKNLKMSEKHIKAVTKESLEALSLDYEKIKDKSPFELSGGEKRRVAIAGILAMSPRILILDEPTAGLDPKARHSVLSMIKKLHKTKSIDVILVSHNMDDIANLCDNVLVLSQGSLLLSGNPSQVFSNYETLKNAGLSQPATMQIMRELNTKDAAFNQSIYNPQKAATQIASVLRGDKR